MSLPTTVFILANGRRQTYVGYSKDVEVTLKLITDGTLEPELAKQGIRKLVFMEEQPTILLAMKRASQIEAMGPVGIRKFVRQHNPDWEELEPQSGRIMQIPKAAGSRMKIAGRYAVFIAANQIREIRVGYTDDLLKAMLRLREATLEAADAERGSARLVYYEILGSQAEARRRARQLRGRSKQKIEDLISEFNTEWVDVAPDAISAIHGGASKRPSRFESKANPMDRPGPNEPPSSGGVTANLPGGPRSPTDVRSGEYEEPLPEEVEDELDRAERLLSEEAARRR